MKLTLTVDNLLDRINKMCYNESYTVLTLMFPEISAFDAHSIIENAQNGNFEESKIFFEI